MPKVGSKHFSYSAKGMAAAKAYAKKKKRKSRRRNLNPRNTRGMLWQRARINPIIK